MKRYLLYITLLSVLFSCDEKKNQVSPNYGFTKVVGSTDFEGDFYPWDVVQTADGGFLVLSSSNTSAFKDINLLKLDENGDFEWELNDTSEYKNPLPRLYESNGQVYFFAMHNLTLTTHLLQVDLSGGALINAQTYPDFLYPVATNEVPNGYLLQCFDREARRTRLMKLNANFNEQWQEDYAVNENPPEFDDHLLQESPLPFFCGHVGTESSATSYFFGGMRNFRLSTNFVNVGNGNVQKTIDGQRYDAGISNMLNMTGNNFFIVKYDVVGQNSVLPFLPLVPNDGAIINSLNPDVFPERLNYELPTRVRTVLKKMRVNGRAVAVMATETKSNQMLINFYSPSNGNLLASKRIGVGNPYLLGNVIATNDGGLLVMCKTYVTGRFSRIAVIKIPADDVSEWF